MIAPGGATEYTRRPVQPISIGIDFGTSNTAAAVLYDSKRPVELLKLDPASSEPRLLKTLLYFPTRKESFFGKSAIDSYFERDMEGRFFQSIKRLLPNPDFVGTTVHGQHITLEELIARFLTHVRLQIQNQVGSLEGVSIAMGRPARYSQEPGNEGLAVVRFKKACDLAGFKNFQLIEEPTAAAKMLPQHHTKPTPELALVADLGGGTSDFTLLDMHPSKPPRALSVHGISVAGDVLDSDFVQAKLLTFFGSEIQYQRPFSSNILTMPTSFMKVLPKWHHHVFLKERSTWAFIQTLHKELVDPSQKPLLDNLITLVEENLGYSLHQRVETMKFELSERDETLFQFQFHPIDIGFKVAAQEFVDIIRSSIEQIVNAAAETLRLGNREPSHLDAIYLTGGTSKVPAIRKALSAAFKNAELRDQDAFTSVASGLALSVAPQ